MYKEINLQEKIFIAGSDGMVGSAILRKMKEKGYGNQKLGGEILAPKRNVLDLLNLSDLKDWFSVNKPTVVILAAAKVGGILANSSYPFDFIYENIKIQNNVIETSWLNGVKRFVFLGSSCIYPKFAKQPIIEEELLTKALEKTNESYALAKITGINLCSSLRSEYSFDAISLMPTNLYGPGDNYNLQNSHVLPALIRKFYDAKKNNKRNVVCWGSGNPKREFLHVDDLSDACLYALKYWDPSSSISPRTNSNEILTYLNVGTGTDISIKELAEKIANEVGYTGDITWDKSKPDGTPKKQLNISRIKNLGWSPKIDLESGIRSTIQAFISEMQDKSLRIK